MTGGHPGTVTTTQLDKWDSFDFIEINFRIPHTFQNSEPRISPNLGPARHQTTSDHQSEAEVSKIDEIEAGDSPGVAPPSRWWCSKLVMNTHSAHKVGTTLRAHTSQPGAGNGGQCLAPFGLICRRLENSCVWRAAIPTTHFWHRSVLIVIANNWPRLGAGDRIVLLEAVTIL